MTDPVTADNLLEVGRTNGAYGVHGSVRIVPFEDGEVLANTKRWFVRNVAGRITEVRVKSLKVHGTLLLAKFEGIDTKEEADQLRGRICVTREDFPETEEGEYCAVDVIGCTVVNREGVTLGKITDIGTNTVQDIFKVEGEKTENGSAPVYLIPDVEAYVLDIDTEAGIVTVDWDPSWT